MTYIPGTILDADGNPLTASTAPPASTDRGLNVRHVGNVNIGNFPTTQAVTGAFFQSTQPVSGTVGVSNFPATQAVTGTFFPETQPVSGSVGVNNFPATQAVSASALPLPTGAASETKLEAVRALLAAALTVQGSVSVSNFPATQAVSGSVSVSNLPATQPVSGTVSVGNFPATQTISGAVSVSSLPALPTGTNAIGSVSVTSLPALPAGTNALGSVSVSNLPATQPVSGSVSVSNLPATQTVSGSVAVSSLPALPTGTNAIGSVSVSNLPATQAVSGSVNVGNFPATQPVSGSVGVSNFPATQAVNVSDASGNALPSSIAAPASTDRGLNVRHVGNLNIGNFPSTQAVTGTFFQATQPVSGSVAVSNFPATQAVSGSVSVGNFPATQAISAAALPLPTGAASETKLEAVRALLAATLTVQGAVSVSSLPALPAGTNAIGSVSVSNLPATQAVSGSVNVGNFPATQAVTGTFYPATQPVSGAVSVSNFPATQTISGSVSVSSLPALPAGSNAIGSVSVSNFPATQAVSGSVSVSSLPALPTGTNAIGSVSVSNLPATQTVSGSVNVGNFPATQAVSGSVTVSTLPPLPTGSNAIGTVGVTALPALPAGSNAIGSVSVSNFPATQAVNVSDGAGNALPSSTAAPASTDRGLNVRVVGNNTNFLSSPNGLAAGLYGTFSAYGYQRVTGEPSVLFSDPFDGAALETAARWNTPTGIYSVNAGTLTVGSSAVSTVSTVTSMPTFISNGLNFNVLGMVLTFESGALSNNVARFVGLGVHTGTPSVASPVTDGVGFELDGAGKFWGAVYSGGVRQASSLDLTSKFIAGPSRYGILLRADLVIFYIGTTEVPVGTISYTPPATQVLPIRIQAITQSTVTSAPTTSIQAVGVHDTGHNNTTLSDGTNPWRKVNIGRSGGLSIKGASVTGVSGSIAAAATGTVGPLDVSEAGNVTFAVKNTVAASPFAGTPVVVFEQSDDNVSWAALPVVRSTDGAVLSQVTLAANAANTAVIFNAALQGVNYVRARVTTGPTTNALTINILPGGMAFTPTASVQQQPLTKGTQGTSGVMTQHLRDAGRNPVHYYTLIPVLTSATDTLMSLTGTKGGATVTATTTPALVSAGKTLRVSRISAAYIATATSGYAMVRVRFNTAGSVTVTSPVAATFATGAGTPITANSVGMSDVGIPEALEFTAGTGIGISVQGFAAATPTAAGYVMVSIVGYEF